MFKCSPTMQSSFAFCIFQFDAYRPYLPLFRLDLCPYKICLISLYA
ncbi:Unknown protein sequence [Pseudomonas viridiflava]|nr:Unknown protein sequence [Pseudomonas viridiflava]